LNGDNDKDANNRKVHFSQALDISYFEGLVSETYNPRKNRWELKKGKRNEQLDTWVLSIAASHHPEIYLHKWKKSDWERRKSMVEPVSMVPNDDGVFEVQTKAAEQPDVALSGGKVGLASFRRGGGGR